MDAVHAHRGRRQGTQPGPAPTRRARQSNVEAQSRADHGRGDGEHRLRDRAADSERAEGGDEGEYGDYDCAPVGGCQGGGFRGRAWEGEVGAGGQGGGDAEGWGGV